MRNFLHHPLAFLIRRRKIIPMSACKCQDGAEERALCMDSKGPPRRGVDCAGAISREAAQWSRSRGNSRKGVGSIPALAFFSFREVTK